MRIKRDNTQRFSRHGDKVDLAQIVLIAQLDGNKFTALRLQGKWSEDEIRALVALIQEWDQVPAGVLPEPQVQVDLSAANLTQGEQLYATNCARCHGPEGQGTPRGPSLNVKSFLTETSDGAIQQIVRNGIPGTAMIGWGDRLTAEEILSIVAYLRNWEATAPEVATPLQRGGGGPPWLQNSAGRGTSAGPARPQQGMGQSKPPDKPSPVPQSPARESLIGMIFSNWRTLLFVVGILALAFFFILGALSDMQSNPEEGSKSLAG